MLQKRHLSGSNTDHLIMIVDVLELANPCFNWLCDPRTVGVIDSLLTGLLQQVCDRCHTLYYTGFPLVTIELN